MIKLQEAKNARDGKLNKIEIIKQIKKPLEFFESFEEFCKGKLEDVSDDEKNFLLKCFGIFHKEDDTFMVRVRIPAGQLESYQALAIGDISHKFGKNYIDITTRQQIELRYLQLEDLPKVLNSLKAVGISTFQTGIDNFRNIVTSSFDGLGEQNLINCEPIIKEMQEIFMENEEWLGTLPRKFNTGILGTKINDCNIYGHDCCFILAKKDDKLGFNLYLGGKVGVQARDSGIFVEQKDVITIYKAVINLFKEFGFRDNRNKNRLHFLLEAVGIEEFISAIRTYTNMNFETSGKIVSKEEFILEEDGSFDLGGELKAYNLSIPSGIFSGIDMIEVGKLALEIDGKIRLSVEQSLYIVSDKRFENKIFESQIFYKYQSYQNIFFRNLISCAGSKTCSFGVIDSKGLAVDMANFLNSEFPNFKGKIRFYWSGCPKGCGIHGVGDIGFEGCKIKDIDGNRVDGIHIFVGGKATKEASEATLLYKALPFDIAKEKVKELVACYRNEKLDEESFEEFITALPNNMKFSQRECFAQE
jgi:ferredoxin-nitrite reductase